MKQFMVLFVLVAAIGISVSAQTYEEVKSRTSKDILVLEKRLNEVKSRIFYLEVTLDQEIAKAKNDALTQLQREKHFAAEEVVKLKEERKALEVAISKLKETSLAATLYRAETDQKSNLPEEMGPVTYKRRVRAQIFKERTGVAGEVKKYPALLMNLKQGLGELTTFSIYPKGMRGVKPLVYVLDPKERLIIDLAPGEYEVDISCGSYHRTVITDIDPAIVKWADGKQIYGGAIKFLSDR